MANTKVTQHVISDNAITTAMITDANITHAKLHSTMDLSGKTVTLPAVAIPSASTATTQSALDNSTKVATTAYVDSAVTALIDSAPSGLNTLNELAAALNDDTSFSSTVTTSLAAKAPLASPSFTGTVQLLDTNFPDNRAARFGDSQDLQIYHDGTHSYVASSTGSLYIRTGNTLQIENQSGSEDLATFAVNGAATLFYDNDAKLATAAYGIDAQGTGALKVPVGTTAQRPSAATGQIRWNSTDGALEVYNGSAWTAVGTGSSNKVLNTFTGDGSTTTFTLTVTPANEDALMVFIDGAYQEAGDYVLTNNSLALDTAPLSGEKVSAHITTASVHDGTSAVNQQFTGDGSTTAFTLTSAPGSENNTQIYINGVYQQKTDYTVSGTTLTFDTAPSNGDIIEVNSFTVTNLGNSDQVTEGSSNLYHTTARAISALTDATLAGNLTLQDASSPTLKIKDTTQNADLRLFAQDSNVGIGTFSNHDMKFYTNSAITLSLKSSGNVGVGTDNAGSKLTVEGDIRQTTGDLLYQGGGNWDIKHLADDQNIVLYTSESGSATEKMRIKANGNVGIGTSSPNAFLSVRKDNNNSGNQFVVADTEGATPGVRTYTHNGDDSGLILNHYYAVGGSGNEYMRYADFVANVGNGAGTTMRFITKNAANTFTTGLVQDNNGNVGISNTSPSALLHVGGDGITVNTTLDVSRTAIFRTTGTGNYSSSGNNSAAHAATFMRGDTANTGDQIGHSYVFNNGGWSATAEIMAEVEDNSTAYSRLNFKTWRGGMATRQVITSEGYVQKAYQPYIRAYGNYGGMATSHGTTVNPWNYWAVATNTGITHSNGVFTVPITGKYLITYSFYFWINNSGENASHTVYLYIGNTNVQENAWESQDSNFSYSDNTKSNSIVYNLTAGDTFKFVTYADTYGGVSHTNMSAYLLG